MRRMTFLQNRESRPTQRQRATIAAWIAALLVIGSSGIGAQRRPDVDGARGDDYQRFLFTPELVMEHQTEIGLTPEQKQALVEEMQIAQSDLVPLQLEMAAAGKSLGRLLEAARVDEAAAVQAAERVMELESEIKSRHLALVIRIKNLLSPEQQQRLSELRDRAWPRR